MPLAVGAVTTTTPITQPTTSSIPASDVGTIQATWIAPDGTQWLLTPPVGVDYGWLTGPGIAGWGAPPVSLTADLHPRGGSRVRFRRAEQRTITWPLLVYGSTHMELTQRRRALTEAFVMTRRLGPGILRVARPDGTARQISAWYQDGAQGSGGEDWLHTNLVVQLLCEDPWWRDVEPTTVYREHQASTTPFLNPFPTVANSQVLGATTITNSGGVEAWPTWTITGPATGLTATNNTTGEAFTLTHTLASSAEKITITTDPPTVRGPSAEVLTGALNWPGAVLWGLQPGVNNVTFTVSGAAAGTSITLSYYARYETA